jgi:hypothetical protein
MCFTPCLSIISWKISPPVIPMNLRKAYVSVPVDGAGQAVAGDKGSTYDSSISLFLGLTRG